MDIKASDLRIGNLIHEEVLGMCEVMEILNNFVFVRANTLESDGSLSKRTFSFDYSHIKPIPLTEELLLRFGFEKPAHSFIGERFYITKQDDSDYWFMAFNKNNAYIKKIKYVHQSQNWYYLINDKELELKTLQSKTKRVND